MSSEAALSLQGRHALVAGVGGPLARPVAIALAEGGATVSLMTQGDDRAQEVEAQSILNECWSLGRDGQVCRLDSTDDTAVEAALDRIEAQLGPVAILATVHGPVTRAAAATARRTEWDAEIARSATSVVVPVLAAGRRMVEREVGRVVNVVSSLCEETEVETALFAASQGAVLALTRALAVEWAPHGVVVRALVADGIEAGSGPHSHGDLRAAVREAVTAEGSVERRVSEEARMRG